jgi:hypothetical protein
MKNLYYVLFAVLLSGSGSCTKAIILADKGCITQITRDFSNGADTAGAIKLFNENNLPAANLLFYRVILNDVIINRQGTFNYQHIFAKQRYNGLMVFNGDIGFHFNNRVLFYQDGPLYGTVKLNTTHKLTLPQLRAMYINAAEKNGVLSNFRDSCLVAQFGYYNLNAGVSYAAPNIVKAWYITPKNSLYPYAYISDDNDATLAFFDGIETFVPIN